MNTTTITIQWQDYDGYRAALSTVSMHPRNTFEQEESGFKLKAETKYTRYTPERLIEVLTHFGCMSEPKKNRRNETEIVTHMRFLIWRYCYGKFDVTQEDIAAVTKHNRSAVSQGLRAISRMLEKRKHIQQLKKEVYAYCDQVFR